MQQFTVEQEGSMQCIGPYFSGHVRGRLWGCLVFASFAR